MVMTIAKWAAVATATLVSLHALTPARAQVAEPAQPQLSQASPAPNPTAGQRRQLEMAMRLVQAAKPRVVCGTTIIPANPNVDRDLVKPIPDQATKFSRRQVPPAACR
jgi:hypothetical protein